MEVSDLNGRKGLVAGIANAESLAWSAAENCYKAGEASVRYLVHELGLLDESRRTAPLKRTIDACEVGRFALMLASDYGQAVTGEIVHVDAGVHIEGIVFH